MCLILGKHDLLGLSKIDMAEIILTTETMRRIPDVDLRNMGYDKSLKLRKWNIKLYLVLAQSLQSDHVKLYFVEIFVQRQS